MSRNYKKELEWQKEKYGRLSAFVERELADELKEHLKG